MGQFNEATNEQMIAMYEKELNILTTAFERERRRQRLLMDEKKNKMKRLKDKRDKMKKMVEGNQFSSLRNKLDGQQEDEQTAQINEMLPDSELTRALKKWKNDRMNLTQKEREAMLANTVLDLNSDAMRKIILRLQILEKDLLELARMKHLKMIEHDGSSVKGKGSKNAGSLLRKDTNKSKVSRK